MPIGDELVLQIVGRRQRKNGRTEGFFGKPAIQKLLTELGALAIAVMNHLPRDLKSVGECRVNPCTPTLLEVDDCYAVVIEAPTECLSECVEQEMLGYPLHHNPSTGKKYFSSDPSPMKA